MADRRFRRSGCCGRCCCRRTARCRSPSSDAPCGRAWPRCQRPCETIGRRVGRRMRVVLALLATEAALDIASLPAARLFFASTWPTSQGTVPTAGPERRAATGTVASETCCSGAARMRSSLPVGHRLGDCGAALQLRARIPADRAKASGCSRSATLEIRGGISKYARAACDLDSAALYACHFDIGEAVQIRHHTSIPRTPSSRSRTFDAAPRPACSTDRSFPQVASGRRPVLFGDEIGLAPGGRELLQHARLLGFARVHLETVVPSPVACN